MSLAALASLTRSTTLPPNPPDAVRDNAQQVRDSTRSTTLFNDPEGTGTTLSPWFEAQQNYASVRAEARQVFSHLCDHAKGNEKWINDGSHDYGCPLKIFKFPPHDESFFCVDRNDPNSVIDLANLPAYDYREEEGSEWRRLTQLSPAPRLFPARNNTNNQGGDVTMSNSNPFTSVNLVNQEPSEDPRAHYMGRVLQGGLDNRYLVDALQALSLRARLLKSIFLHVDMSRCIFGLMLHKNGTWARVFVDDYVPCDAEGFPIQSVSDEFPEVLWPSIVEKAYAKLHVCGGSGKSIGGWEVLAEGGDSAAALVDFTGGVGGAFSTKDVSPDRLFIYLHELQAECLFMCHIDRKNCEVRGVKLSNWFPYTLNRVAQFEGQCYVQLHSAALVFEDGGLQDDIPYNLMHHEDYRERQVDGFFWIDVNDFAYYFDTIYEVRLVNSGDLGRLPNMPPPRFPMQIYPCFDNGEGSLPMFEEVWCYGGICYPDTTPDFSITITDAPCEVSVCLSQTDFRLIQKQPGRPTQSAVLLKVYEHVLNAQTDEGDPLKHVAFVCKSHWGNNRDSLVCFRVTKPNTYIVAVSLPKIGQDGAPVEVKRMILRVYSTTKIKVQCNVVQTPSLLVHGVPTHAMKWSLIGASERGYHAVDNLTPLPADPEEGRGIPFAYRFTPLELEAVS